MARFVWEGQSAIDPQKDVTRDGAMTIPFVVERNAREYPDDVILVDSAAGRATSSHEFAVACRKAARGLRALGFHRGDCLCTLMPNDYAWYVAAVAAQSLGGTISGINPQAPAGEIAGQLSRVPAKAILVFPPLAETAKSIAEANGIAIVLSTAPGTGLPVLAEIDGPGEPELPPCFAEDPALFPFSSGTTGVPKPVVISHRNLLASGMQTAIGLALQPGDRFLGLAPLFHIVGPSLFATSLLSRSAVVIAAQFDPERVFDALARHGISHAPLMAPIVRALARHPAGRDREFPRLKAVISSGAPLAKADQEAAAERFGCPVIQVYGMTESSAITADDLRTPVPGSVGKPISLVRLRIAHPQTGDFLPAGGEGEIQISGPNVMAGYLGQPGETAKIMTQDGWLRTGDLGRVDSDGRLFITGRIKEMIKVNSAQVAPAELEMLFCGHPAVTEAGVIGRPNEYCGEIPIAFLALREPFDPFVIVDWVNDQVIRYKRVRAVHIIDTLPKNATGKIDRKALAQLDRNLSFDKQGATL